MVDLNQLESGIKTWDPGIPNSHLLHMISAVNISVEDQLTDLDWDNELRIELDTHANMPAVGRNVLILSDLGKTVKVNPFSLTYKPMKTPAVDPAI